MPDDVIEDYCCIWPLSCGDGFEKTLNHRQIARIGSRLVVDVGGHLEGAHWSFVVSKLLERRQDCCTVYL